VIVRDHRAVQVEIDAVDRELLLQLRQQLSKDALERIRGDLSRGARGRPGGSNERMPGGAQRLHRALRRNVGSFDGGKNRLAVLGPGPAAAGLELRVVRARGRESVG